MTSSSSKQRDDEYTAHNPLQTHVTPIAASLIQNSSDAAGWHRIVPKLRDRLGIDLAPTKGPLGLCTGQIPNSLSHTPNTNQPSAYALRNAKPQSDIFFQKKFHLSGATMLDQAMRSSAEAPVKRSLQRPLSCLPRARIDRDQGRLGQTTESLQSGCARFKRVTGTVQIQVWVRHIRVRAFSSWVCTVDDGGTRPPTTQTIASVVIVKIFNPRIPESKQPPHASD